MRYKLSNVIWGAIFIIAGICITGNVFDWWDFHLFFNGWWTLFIIIPCAIGVVQNGFGNGSTIGLAIGVFLLLGCQDVIEWHIVRRLILPIILVGIGLIMILKNIFAGKRYEMNSQYQGNADFAAVFASRSLESGAQKFYGAELNSVFGSLCYDLRNAVIEEDVVIKVSTIFGGIDILVPSNVKVKTSSTSLFGGISNKTGNKGKEIGPTVYITGSCMFGGVDIK